MGLGGGVVGWPLEHARWRQGRRVPIDERLWGLDVC
jgi:hypothetical protein